MRNLSIYLNTLSANTFKTGLTLPQTRYNDEVVY